jgi:zona occludens toxin
MKASMLAEGVDEAKIGELVCIPHEKVLEPTFWRTDYDADKGIDSFLQPGDLLALDEIWRFWNGLGPKSEDGREKRPERVMNFVRMHRQMTHPITGTCCDVAIITQDPADIHRSIRGVVEETYVMTKLTAIGAAARYRVDCFQKTRTTRRPLTSYQRSYDPAKFGFYRSHSQRKEGDADAREENIDDRGNILKGALFRVVLPISVLVVLLSVWWLYRFFHPESQKAAMQTESKFETKDRSAARAPDSGVSDEWRVVGYFDFGSGINFYLHNGDGPRIVVGPPNFKLTAHTAEVLLPSGEAVTSWSGGKAKTGGLIDQAAGGK